MKLLLVILSVVIAFASFAAKTARFATVFTDNLVLQQKSDIKIWGYANPGETLSLQCSWINKVTKIAADKTGNWLVTIQTPVAGFNPESLVLTDSKNNTIKLSNILIGEVWLCSGQSNMEMILKSQPSWNMIVENSEAEIAAANYPNIRFVNIKRKESFIAQEEVISNGWKVCTPDDVQWLSAVAYFFAKKLTKELDVPVGLIVSAYGGSPVQSWIPESAANSKSLYFKENESRDAEVKASKQTEAEYEKAMTAWIADAEMKSIPQSTNSSRQNLTLPVNFEKSAVGNQQGEISLSKEIVITDEMAGKDLNVKLGTMDDLGRVYFNGELVWSEIRNSKSYSQVQFTIPAGKVKAGISVLEAKVLNVLWGGGLTGPSENMYYTIGNNSDKTSLTGQWQYRKIFDLAEAKPVPNEGKPLFSTLSALYNGMIYPLRNFTIKGCLWYQGESNVGDAQRYSGMFTDMITSWRKAFNNEFPFYYVQIAPYKYGGNQDSKAAELRESQASVEKAVPNTGMVVTIDLGNTINIHPAKKQEVGDRLCNLALAEAYHRNIPYKSPSLQKAKMEGNKVEITFQDTYKGLVLQGDCHKFELSSDGKIFFPASISLHDNSILVTSAQVSKPGYVRYCWGDASAGTILNSENLPLSSFRAEVLQ